MKLQGDRMHRSIRNLWLAAIVLALPGTAALAASGPHSDPAAGPEWEFSITPYAWLPGISGDVAGEDGEPSVDIDVSNTDALLAVNWVGFMAAEARRNRLILFGDVIGLNSTSEMKSDVQTVAFPGTTLTESLSRNVSKTVDVGPGQIELGPANVNGTVTLDIPGFEFDVGPIDLESNVQMVMVDLKLGYRVLDRPVAGLFGGQATAEDKRRITFDVFGGGRYMDLKIWNNVSIPPAAVPSFTVTPRASVGVQAGGGTLPGIPVEIPEIRAGREIEFDGVTIPEQQVISGGTIRGRSDARWVDPVIGARLRGDFTDEWYWLLAGDIGGFGIGSASDLTWQAVAGVGWRFGEHWGTNLVWRALSIRRPLAGSDVDLTFQGPQLGFTYTF